MSRLPALLLCALGCGFAGCAEPEFGRVDPRVLELAGAGPGEGVVEFQLDADGRMVSARTFTRIDRLPGVLREETLRVLPGATIVLVARITLPGAAARDRATWEVLARAGDANHRITLRLDASGAPEVLGTEHEIDRAIVPRAILDAIERAHPRFEARAYLVVERGPVVEYAARGVEGGADTRVAFAPDGTPRGIEHRLRADLLFPR